MTQLAPPKGDSDPRGRTPADVEPPADALLDVRGLEKHFPIRRGFFGREVGAVRAVDGVSFWLRRGETLGLVGESGSGKTTAGRTILRLLEPTAGTALFDGADIFGLDDDGLRRLRRRAQIVFQDPFGSLNPRMTVGDAIREVLRVHGLARGSAAVARTHELLNLVGLPAGHAGRYPHEFSGGQRQRVGIARALSVEPEFIVCDEPVSALDVSVQAQVLNLLEDLQTRLGLAYLFIAHDLSVVEHVSDRIAVMYLGRIVEIGDAAEVIREPVHPYTRALLSAVPVPEVGARFPVPGSRSAVRQTAGGGERGRGARAKGGGKGGRGNGTETQPLAAGIGGVELGPRDSEPTAPEATEADVGAVVSGAGSPLGTHRRGRIVLPGDVPSPAAPPSGCPFHPRCPHPLKDADCAAIVPPLAEKRPRHFAACIKERAFVEQAGGRSNEPM